MTATRPRRTGTRAAETAARRARLLTAALELAASGGYEAVQMRDVAARAEVALGTLYRHYASKDQLLLAAMLDQTETLRRRLDQHPARGGTAAERVSTALEQACRALERQPRTTGALVRAMFSTEPEAAELKLAVQRELDGIIVRAIGTDSGHDPDTVAAVVDTLGHVWFSVMAFWAGGVSGTPMGPRLTTAAHLLLD